MRVPSDTFLDRHQESNPPQTAHFSLQSPQNVHVHVHVCVCVWERERGGSTGGETQYKSHRKCLKGSMGQIGDGTGWTRILKRKTQRYSTANRSDVGKTSLLPGLDIWCICNHRLLNVLQLLRCSPTKGLIKFCWCTVLLVMSLPGDSFVPILFFLTPHPQTAEFVPNVFPGHSFQGPLK